jgi:hypothetical protein
MDLEECREKGFIRKIKINTNLVKSLIEISSIKEKSVMEIELNDININAFLPMAYDSLREILEAYCILYGFKVGNHICLGKLVKKLNPKFDLILFDRLRYMRNGINYYGNKVDLNQGKEIIHKIFLLKKEIQEDIII